MNSESVHQSELDEEKIRQLEEYEISQGPLSVLQQSVKNNTQILIALRNNRKILARCAGLFFFSRIVMLMLAVPCYRVKAFDRHCNLVLEVSSSYTLSPHLPYYAGHTECERDVD